MSQETMNLIVTGIIVPVLTAVGGFLAAYINLKTKELKMKINNDALNKYVSIAEDTVTKVVGEVFQTYVDALKKDGKFDNVSQIEAFRKAKTKVLTLLSKEAIEAVEYLYGDVNRWLETQIENAVHQDKVYQLIAH
ncbi:MAG: hypothetical protein PWP27_601 [Clostridiales bacterium]|jgi:hypothetical protein|nr:hypothetical protein [Clostridiales bacterium]